MHLKCKPEKVDETILAVRNLAVGGDLRVEKVQMSQDAWAAMFEDSKMVNRRTGRRLMSERAMKMSDVDVEFIEIAANEALIVLGPLYVEPVDPAPIAVEKKTTKKAKK